MKAFLEISMYYIGFTVYLILKDLIDLFIVKINYEKFKAWN